MSDYCTRFRNLVEICPFAREHTDQHVALTCTALKMKVATILSLMASVTVVSASATGQLLAFTSSQSAASGLQLPTAQSVSGFVRSLFDHDRMQGACSLDAIALVRIQDQHFDRTTFSSLSHSPLSLRARALDAPSQVTFPATQDLSVATAVNDAIRLCNRKAAHQDDSRAGQLVEASVDSHKSLSLIQIHVQNVRADGTCICNAFHLFCLRLTSPSFRRN